MEETVPSQPGKIMPNGRFIKLLILLLGMLILVPLVEELVQAPALGEFFFSAVVCYAAYSYSHNKRTLSAAVATALPAIVAMWLNRFIQVSWLSAFGNLCGIVFLAIITTAILGHIFHHTDITSDTIAAAVVAYLFIALMWSLFYGVLETAYPGSFKFAEGATPFGREIFTYFSLVTITTVGYGDIVPVTPIARAFANLEAVVGQLYLVVLVSWLVGSYIARNTKR